MKICEITDGTSNTYLVGEKYLCPDYYLTGNDWGDDQSAYAGDSDDQNRWTGTDTATAAVPMVPAPMQDTPGLAGGTYEEIFGSAHAIGFNMALCDGSVKVFNYTIDPLVHNYLGNRKDGLPIDGNKF